MDTTQIAGRIITCPRCKAQNRTVRCGCSRGEWAVIGPVNHVDNIRLPGFTADGRKVTK